MTSAADDPTKHTPVSDTQGLVPVWSLPSTQGGHTNPYIPRRHFGKKSVQDEEMNSPKGTDWKYEIGLSLTDWSPV